MSQAAFAASDLFGNLLSNRIKQQGLARQQERETPLKLAELATQLGPAVTRGMNPQAAQSLYEQVARALGGQTQGMDFSQFTPPPADPYAGIVADARKADFRERVPTDSELDYAAQQSGEPAFPLSRTEADTGQSRTVLEGVPGSKLNMTRQVLDTQRQALPPLRVPAQGGRRTVTTVNAQGRKVEQLIDDQGKVIAEFLSPPDKPEKPAADPNAPKPFRDNPELPQGVLRYIFDLTQKQGAPVVGKDGKVVVGSMTADKATKEVARQMPQLLRTHPNLNPLKVKQAIDQAFRKPGQALVIPPELLSNIFGGDKEP